MKIAVLGAGSVGGTLGARFAALGHEVVFGVPEPSGERARAAVARAGDNASAATVGVAARDAQVVVLATPWEAAEAALKEAGDLAGKVVVDCTNPLKFEGGELSLALGFDTSGAEAVADWARGAHVVKAFNQTGYGNMAEPEYEGVRAVMFVCGDDAESRSLVRELVASVGFDALDAGGLRAARLLEPLAMLWIHLSMKAGLGRDFAFALLRREAR